MRAKVGEKWAAALAATMAVVVIVVAVVLDFFFLHSFRGKCNSTCLLHRIRLGRCWRRRVQPRCARPSRRRSLGQFPQASLRHPLSHLRVHSSDMACRRQGAATFRSPSSRNCAAIGRSLQRAAHREVDCRHSSGRHRRRIERKQGGGAAAGRRRSARLCIARECLEV